MDLGLKGRTAVITGGSKGIGKAIAKSLAAEGVNLVLLARGKAQLDQTAEEIKSLNGDIRVLPVRADITRIDSLKSAAAATAARFDVVHILVNNAGPGLRRLDRQITWSDTEWMEDVNLKLIGMLRTIQSFLSQMARDGSGRIINISGIAGSMVWEPAMTHGLVNSAMIHGTKYLAQDLAGEQITVNSVVPGLVGTEWRETWAENLAAQQGKTKEEFLEAFCEQKGILLRRWAGMEEVSDMVTFVASDRARYITGSSIFVDGGFNVNAR